jgi:hypothetical protein
MERTQQRLLHGAVGRDLFRAVMVLRSDQAISPDRRQALAAHLAWLLALTSTGQREVEAARRTVDAAARVWYVDDGDEARAALADAVAALARLHDSHPHAPEPPIGRLLDRQVHWLVDGLEPRLAQHLVRLLGPREPVTRTRQRAEVYRYRRRLLWGSG